MKPNKQLIQEKVKEGDFVLVDNKKYVIADLLTHCYQVHKINNIPSSNKEKALRIKGKFLGYRKPEITVHRIHLGKILTNSRIYVDTNYTIV